MAKWIIFCSIISGITSLRISKFEVPNSVDESSAAILKCEFDLEEDSLYSLKWYRNHLEFYRYLPHFSPEETSFPILGFSLNLNDSNIGTVYLEDITRDADGKYTCEVSADAPSFRTVRDSGHMSVIVQSRNVTT